jgi:hypothetical protein
MANLIGSVPFKSGAIITQLFGEHPEIYQKFGLAGHEGVDLIPRDSNWNILAIADGEVVRMAFSAKDYGNYVVVLNLAMRFTLWYCHLASTGVQLGQKLKIGDFVGVMGETGNATGPHLHAGKRETDAAGNPIHLDNGYQGFVDPLPMLTGGHVRTPRERLVAAWRSMGITYNEQEVTAFLAKARLLALGYPLADEYRDLQQDGLMIAGQAFDPGVVLETLEGQWSLDKIRPFSLITGEAWSPGVSPSPGPAPKPELMPYTFPPVLATAGALGEEGVPVPGQPFYRLTGAAVRTGSAALVAVTLIGKNGIPLIGGRVVNLFADGSGEVIQTDGSGTARFQLAASPVFSDPGTGPCTVFVADDSTFIDMDNMPNQVVYKAKLSDRVKSLGDFQGARVEIYLQFLEQEVS